MLNAQALLAIIQELVARDAPVVIGVDPVEVPFNRRVTRDFIAREIAVAILVEIEKLARRMLSRARLGSAVG